MCTGQPCRSASPSIALRSPQKNGVPSVPTSVPVPASTSSTPVLTSTLHPLQDLHPTHPQPIHSSSCINFQFLHVQDCIYANARIHSKTSIASKVMLVNAEKLVLEWMEVLEWVELLRCWSRCKCTLTKHCGNAHVNCL